MRPHPHGILSTEGNLSCSVLPQQRPSMAHASGTFTHEGAPMYAALLSALASNDFAAQAIMSLSSIWGWGG